MDGQEVIWMVKMETVAVENPDQLNLIFGQSHFIKTVEDIHETLVTSVPGIKFGVAFCEASAKCLVRHSGTDEGLVELAVKNARRVGCGHTFFIFLRDAYPVNVLKAVQAVT
jgi:adenosine/AMP kinase